MVVEKFNLSDWTIANGKIVVKKLSDNVYEVMRIAKNVNYEGVPDKIEVGDFVYIEAGLWRYLKALDGDFLLVYPKQISAIKKK